MAGAHGRNTDLRGATSTRARHSSIWRLYLRCLSLSSSERPVIGAVLRLNMDAGTEESEMVLKASSIAVLRRRPPRSTGARGQRMRGAARAPARARMKRLAECCAVESASLHPHHHPRALRQPCAPPERPHPRPPVHAPLPLAAARCVAARAGRAGAPGVGARAHRAGCAAAAARRAAAPGRAASSCSSSSAHTRCTGHAGDAAAHRRLAHAYTPRAAP